VWWRYRSARGSRLWLQDINYSSEEAAEAAWSTYLAQATNIVGYRRVRDGGSTQEYALAVVRDENHDVARFLRRCRTHLTWMEGPTWHEVLELQGLVGPPYTLNEAEAAVVAHTLP
jgi:hypothetical protein